jgi:hypothetical protein
MNDLDECELLYSQLLDADNSLNKLHSAFQHLNGSHQVAINTDKQSHGINEK